TRCLSDWSSDVCSSDLGSEVDAEARGARVRLRPGGGEGRPPVGRLEVVDDLSSEGEHARLALVVDLVRRVRGLVVVLVRAREEEEYGNLLRVEGGVVARPVAVLVEPQREELGARGSHDGGAASAGDDYGGGRPRRLLRDQARPLRFLDAPVSPLDPAAPLRGRADSADGERVVLQAA